MAVCLARAAARSRRSSGQAPARQSPCARELRPPFAWIQRGSATSLRRKLTLLSRAQMACLHSSAVPSIRWVIRPVRLIFGVFASMTGAGASEKRVTDEQQQRLDRRDLPSDGSRVAPIRGAGVKEAGRGVSRGHLPSTPRPIWVMSIASGSGTWRSVAFWNRKQMEIWPNRQEGVL